MIVCVNIVPGLNAYKVAAHFFCFVYFCAGFYSKGLGLVACCYGACAVGHCWNNGYRLSPEFRVFLLFYAGKVAVKVKKQPFQFGWRGCYVHVVFSLCWRDSYSKLLARVKNVRGTFIPGVLVFVYLNGCGVSGIMRYAVKRLSFLSLVVIQCPANFPKRLY